MTTSHNALARTGLTRSALTLAKAHLSQHLSRRLLYYITPEESPKHIGAAENDGDRPFLRLLNIAAVSVAVPWRLEQMPALYVMTDRMK